MIIKEINKKKIEYDNEYLGNEYSIILDKKAINIQIHVGTSEGFYSDIAYMKIDTDVLEGLIKEVKRL